MAHPGVYKTHGGFFRGGKTQGGERRSSQPRGDQFKSPQPKGADQRYMQDQHGNGMMGSTDTLPKLNGRNGAMASATK